MSTSAASERAKKRGAEGNTIGDSSFESRGEDAAAADDVAAVESGDGDGPALAARAGASVVRTGQR
jgi:hypothetical protein